MLRAKCVLVRSATSIKNTLKLTPPPPPSSLRSPLQLNPGDAYSTTTEQRHDTASLLSPAAKRLRKDVSSLAKRKPPLGLAQSVKASNPFEGVLSRKGPVRVVKAEEEDEDEEVSEP